MRMHSTRLACRAGDEKSVTVTVKGNAPVIVGVPEIVPVDGLSVSPGGRASGSTLHEYSGVPPSA